MIHALEDLTVCGVGGKHVPNSMWSVLFLRDEQRSERETAAWAGERVVRDDFTEIGRASCRERV